MMKNKKNFVSSCLRAFVLKMRTKVRFVAPIRIIIEREYLTRVKKKSFIVMTILAPLLIVAAYSLIIYLMVSDATASKKNITV